MKKTWKKVTPIPPEFNGHGFLWYCTKCGYCTAYAGIKKEPPYKCPKCGNGDTK